MGDALGICTATLLASPLSDGSDAVAAAAAAAVEAGFTSASVWAHQVDAVVGSGLSVAVVEGAMSWPNGSADAVAKEAASLARVASSCGAGLIGGACMDPAIESLARARENLAAYVDAGLRVAIEFLPWTGLATLADAWSLVEPVPGVDLLLDTWHWQRQPGGPAWDVLRSIPGERIAYLQVCDAAPVPDGEAFAECMSSRLLPGEGVVDFASVYRVLDEIGAAPYVATEIFNPGLVASLGARGAAEAMRTAGARPT